MAAPTVVLLPLWGAGHLMPMLEAGKRLLTRGRCALSLTVLAIPPPPTEELAADLASAATHPTPSKKHLKKDARRAKKAAVA